MEQGNKLRVLPFCYLLGFSFYKSFLHMLFLNFLHILFLVTFVIFLKPFFCFIKAATGINLFLGIFHNTFLHSWSLVSQLPFTSKHYFLIHLKCFHYFVSVISLIFCASAVLGGLFVFTTFSSSFPLICLSSSSSLYY